MIGILGGVGSGKSTVVKQITGHHLHIVDADGIGHQLLKNPQIQSDIREAFGDGVFSDANTIERSALATRVFGDDQQQTDQRNQLNSIIHPAIRKEIHAQLDNVPAEADAIILDAALLLEGKWDVHCDWLIFIDTPRDVRIRRVAEFRNWTHDELDRRESSQMSVSVKKDRSDFMVDNSGSLDDAAQQLQEILDSVIPEKP